MSGRHLPPQPTDTALARFAGRTAGLAGTLAKGGALDLVLVAIGTGALLGLLVGGAAGGVLGLPLVAALLARNIRPDLAVCDVAGRFARIADAIGDAMIFALAAMLLFLPGYLLGLWLRGTIAAAWGIG